MNEPSQESNCIVIDAPSPLYSLSVKDEELIETFSKRNFNDYKRLWSDIASNKLTGNNGEKLSSDTIYNSSDDLLVPYIIDLLRNNKDSPKNTICILTSLTSTKGYFLLTTIMKKNYFKISKFVQTLFKIS